MPRSLFSALALVVTIAGAAVVAQSKPNFTGKWTLVPEAGATQPGRGVGGLGPAFGATQDDKTLAITTNIQPVGEIKTTYNLDGSETKNPMTMNGTTVDRTSKVKWDGAKLVVSTTVSFGGQDAQTTQTWSLDASGNLVVEQVSDFGGGPQTTKATYKKG